ncbi:MAG: hypothetical protein HY820_10535 [Acidobacteria bacterium]|nr:hypothetical protein [Acidobacteriota bacterium]
MRDPDRMALLDPLWHVLAHLDQERDFGHPDAIAWLRSTHSFLQFRLPWQVEDSWSVEGRFQVRPLLRFLSPRRRFHVLALARHHVRMLEGNESACGTVAAPAGMPASPEHGYEAVERALQPLLRVKPWPLVLAGTGEDVALYRSVNGYMNTVAEPVMMSPDGDWSDRELGRSARDVLSRWRSAEERQALAVFGEASETGRVSTVAEEVVQSASAGRVLHLFLEDEWNGTHTAGRIPEDLVNAAVVETIRHGGNVWQMALDAPAGLVAVYRW